MSYLPQNCYTALECMCPSVTLVWPFLRVCLPQCCCPAPTMVCPTVATGSWRLSARCVALLLSLLGSSSCCCRLICLALVWCCGRLQLKRCPAGGSYAKPESPQNALRSSKTSSQLVSALSLLKDQLQKKRAGSSAQRCIYLHPWGYPMPTPLPSPGGLTMLHPAQVLDEQACT